MYPFAIYFGLNYFSPSSIALFLFVILSLRLILLREKLTTMPWLLPATLLGIVAILFSVFSDSTMGFKLYPVAVNLTMLLVFFYSYLKPPTVIESLARLTEKNFSEHAVVYTTKVTLAWCVFFLINGLISVYTATKTSLEIWMFYNGFLSYIFIGLFMAIEYLIRRQVKKTNLKSHQPLVTQDKSNHHG